MLRRMVPVTYLFVVFFLANELERTSSLSRLGPVARSTIELEGIAWASRYVLLCEWGESATKFTMNVSIKTYCFRSKTPTESSCRQSRPVYPRQSNPRRSKPERCTRAYYGLDDFSAARQASRFRPATA